MILGQSEAIKMGREWIEHAPPFDGRQTGPEFFFGAAGYVCRSCCRRIIMRGCDLRKVASDPIWEAPGISCALC